MPRAYHHSQTAESQRSDGERKVPRKRKLYAPGECYISNDSIYDIRPLRTDRKQEQHTYLNSRDIEKKTNEWLTQNSISSKNIIEFFFLKTFSNKANDKNAIELLQTPGELIAEGISDLKNYQKFK